MALGSTASAAAPAGFLGMSAPRAKSGEFARMADGGVGTYRLVASWHGVQGSRDGPFHWGHIDREVSAAATNGIQPIITLFGSAPFVSSDPRVPPVGTAVAQRGWKRFVAAAVARYGPEGELWSERPELPYMPVRTWEVWQEQNATFFWHGRGGPSPRRYAKLVRLTDSAASELDPGAQLLVGGMFDDPSGRKSIAAKKYLQGVYKTGVASRFDGVGVHPYAKNVGGVMREIEQTRRVMDRRGDFAKLIWVTEIGWSTKGPRGWALVTSRGGQARKLESTFSKLIARRGRYGLRAVIWFSWRDYRDRECRWCGGSGVLTSSGKPKPAWSRFSSIAGPVG